jgi:hypothetical protein
MNEENPVPQTGDPLDLAKLTMPADFWTGHSPDKPQTVRRYKKQAWVKWYKCEATVLDRAFATTGARRNAWSVVAVLMALYELWFTDPDKRNPVSLTSYNLQRFALSREQKYRALQILEGAQLISVNRTKGKNPRVTLTWLPLRK